MSEPVQPQESTHQTAPPQSQPLQTTPTPSPTPSQPDTDHVWISREEYQRLQSQAQGQPLNLAMAPGDYQATASSTVVQQKRSISVLQIAVGLALAFMLFLSLTIEAFSWMFLFSIVGFAIFGYMTYRDWHLAQKNDIATAQTLSSKNVFKGLLIAIIAIILAPFLFFTAMITILIVMMSTGQTRGS